MIVDEFIVNEVCLRRCVLLLGAHLRVFFSHIIIIIIILKRALCIAHMNVCVTLNPAP